MRDKYILTAESVTEGHRTSCATPSRIPFWMPA